MKLNRLRLSVVAITGTLLAILVVSPAIGGPSLKQWLKKRVGNEVEKQLNSKHFNKRLRAKTGPAGPAGADGVSGGPGATGARDIRHEMWHARGSPTKEVPWQART